MLSFTDTHTHLYSEEFNNDKKEAILRAFQAGVNKFYLPAIDSSYTEAMKEIRNLFPENIFLMAGLHPCSVKENYLSELERVREFMKENEFSGIGETGLDLYWDKTFFQEQIKSLHQHIQWALEFGKPIILHTRNANKEAIDIVSEYQGSGLKGIFHCFSGTAEDAQRMIELGFYLGIGGVLTFKNSGLDKVVQKMNLENIVLETDSPYLAPAPYRGKRNESSYIPIIAKKLAEIKNVSLEEVSRITNENARKIYQ